ncbi:MAG: FAD-binding domain-containing protein, partial [Pseudomonadota bacterium]
MPETNTLFSAEPAVMEPSRRAAFARLEAFVPKAGRQYASGRNTDRGAGAHTSVSLLSPYLRHRLVLEQEVLAAVRAKHSVQGAEKFISEVFWRTYFKGFLERRPTIWSSYQTDLESQRNAARRDNALAADLADAEAGRTGIDAFDHWANELVDTGYLHNHARMWFASIWIFTLGLPWQWGADFFLRHLLDGDPASNTLSWRWVGGLHTKGKTYLARPDNIARYTEGRFSPKNLAREAPALVEDEVHDLLPPPAPTVTPREDVLLLLTEEDCAPETLKLTAKGILATNTTA